MELGGPGKVSQAFYREIEIRLGKEDVADKARKAAVKWRRYKELLEIGNVFVEATDWLVGSNLRDALFLALVILGGSLGAVNRAGSAWFIAALMFGLAGVIRFGGDIKDLGSESNVYQRPISSRSQSDLELSLRNLQRPVLIVIDDVDRLSAIEIREVIQLVKANASLPNIIYLLLFERRVVEHALNEITTGEEANFWKIVQVPFDVPNIERLQLEAILVSNCGRSSRRCRYLSMKKGGQHFLRTASRGISKR